MNRRRGRRKEGDPEARNSDVNKRRLAMKRRMGEKNGLNFIGLSISLSDINVSENNEVLAKRRLGKKG